MVQAKQRFLHYAQKLTIMAHELKNRLEHIEKDIHRQNGAISKDFAEQTVDVENDQVIDEIGRVTQTELNQVQAALSRLEHGNFGICLACGHEISTERLDVLPMAEHCKNCA